MLYSYKPKALRQIWSFYRNVALKYSHTYAYEDLERNVRQAVLNGYQIELNLSRRNPTLKRWEGMFMAKAGKWYYAYTINNDRVIIHDACHQQNMHE